MSIGKDWFQKLITKMKNNRKFEFLVYGGVIAVILVIYFTSTYPRNTNPSERIAVASNQNDSFGEQQVEERLEQTLSTIRGVGNVEVMITYATGPEIVPAMNTDVQENSTQNSTGTTASLSESTRPATVSRSGVNEPIVLTERQPTIRGVIIVAEGAEDISVQMDLERAAKTVLGVPLDCIQVFEMTGE